MDNSKPIILIVEDAPANIAILNAILSSCYQIKIAIDGERALKIAMEKLPELILLDITLPGIDGYEVCDRLKNNEKTKDIPIIFITAKNEIEDEEKGFSYGAIDYITKPVIPNLLKARVKNHIDLKLAQQKLKEQNKKLQANLKLREDMTNMIVHDIRTPLSSILSFSELLTMRNGVLSKYKKYVEKIKKSANTINSFINDMLMLARTESEELILNRSYVDIKELISTVRDIHIHSAKVKAISITIDVPETLEETFIDKNLFCRVLDNLLSNALKFSPAESTINIKAVPIKMQSYKCMIEIKDQGVGIPFEKREQIFDKFGIVELNQEGLSQIGLGLAFCKLVVQTHKGHILVSENKPQGTTFTIKIP